MQDRQGSHTMRIFITCRCYTAAVYSVSTVYRRSLCGLCWSEKTNHQLPGTSFRSPTGQVADNDPRTAIHVHVCSCTHQLAERQRYYTLCGQPAERPRMTRQTSVANYSVREAVTGCMRLSLLVHGVALRMLPSGFRNQIAGF